jgi:ABC-type sugar transport system permease subunit
MDMYIGYVMFGNQRLAYAAGLAWIMFIIVIGIAIYLFRTADKWVYYPLEGER